MKLPLFFITTFIFLSLTSFSQTLYVDSSATLGGNGGSWTSAFTELSDALDSAWHNPMIEEVLVAKGTYHPANKPYEMNVSRTGIERTNFINRTKTFHVRTGLEIFGGFPNGGGVRDLVLNATTLDGVLAAGDSSYQVVYLDSSYFWASINDTTVVDGFIIQNGNRAHVPTFDTIANGAFYYNAYGGAGIFATTGTFRIENNKIRNNILTGIAVMDTASVIIANNEIYNNSAYSIDSSDGSTAGGLHAVLSNVWLSNNYIHNNIAYDGGGVLINLCFEVLVRNNRISNNEGYTMAGAAVYSSYGPSCLIENNIIDSNKGGIGALSTYSATVRNNFIFNNDGGLGVGIMSGRTDFYNNVLYKNNSTTYGAIEVFQGDSILFVNNTFVKNTINVFRICCGTSLFINNIFSGNGDEFSWSGSVDSIKYIFKNNFLQDDSSQYNVSNWKPLDSLAIDNLYNLNALFLDINDPLGPDNIFGTADDGLHLQGNSPCIDSGSNNLLPAGITTDITGAPRIQNGVVNMGAYESLAWPLAINNKVDREVLDVFPNPTHEKINIETPMNGELFIMDVIGNKIGTYQVEKGITQLDVSRFAGGPYFITLNNNYKSWNAKFIKR